MLLGIHGRIGSGKTTFASVLQTELRRATGVHFEVRSFADALRESIAFWLDLPFDQVKSEGFKTTPIPPLGGMTGRELLQKMGTDALRNQVHPDIHLLKMFRCYRPNIDCWIIDDVRFDNEAQAIRERAGRLIRILRPEPQVHALEGVSHESESGLDAHLQDFQIVNNDSFDALKPKALWITQELTTKCS